MPSKRRTVKGTRRESEQGRTRYVGHCGTRVQRLSKNLEHKPIETGPTTVDARIVGIVVGTINWSLLREA